jgi:hypothetical protein
MIYTFVHNYKFKGTTGQIWWKGRNSLSYFPYKNEFLPFHQIWPVVPLNSYYNYVQMYISFSEPFTWINSLTKMSSSPFTRFDQLYLQHCHPIHKDNKVTGIFNYLEGLLKCQNHSGVLTKVYQVQLIKSGEGGTKGHWWGVFEIKIFCALTLGQKKIYVCLLSHVKKI